MIVRTSKGWEVRSLSGKSLGTYKSKKEAKEEKIIWISAKNQKKDLTRFMAWIFCNQDGNDKV